MRIIADTATLLSPAQGAEMGLTIVPVCVAINGQTYRDFADIDSETFLRLIRAGGVPTSSQPSVGDVLEVYGESEEETLFITVGDGLSGGYQTAVGAKNTLEKNEHIHVVNSKTLAGPLRYLAKKALMLKEQGVSLAQIKETLQRSIESSRSFVVPADFAFLQRSGRLLPIAAKLGGALKLLPVLTQTEDKTRIRLLTVKRTWKTAVGAILQQLQQAGVGAEHLISVCHAGIAEQAEAVRRQVREVFPRTETEVLPLSPALITHGGPGCIVIQSILK